jgi:hypothetical protein
MGAVIMVSSASRALAQQAEVVTNGLIAHYCFDGNLTNNLIKNQATFAIARNTTLAADRFGRQQMAAKLNGINSYILSSVNRDFTNSRITVSAWATLEGLNAANDGSTFFNRWRSQSGSYWDDLSLFGTFPSPDNYFMINWSGKDGNPPTDGYIIKNQFSNSGWTHVALSVSESNARIYTNGVLSISITNKLAARQLFTNTAAWGFGAQNDGNGPINFWRGRLDDIRIYNRDLSAQEVNRLFEIENQAPADVNLEPRPAKATAVLFGNLVKEIVLEDSGYGYTTAPKVLFESPTGQNAVAYAIINGGVVTGFTITYRGSGYTNPPLVKIASPPFDPILSIAVSKVSVTLKVVLGLKYQLETSTDLLLWEKAGEEFVAKDENLIQEFDVNAVGKYFRVLQIK